MKKLILLLVIALVLSGGSPVLAYDNDWLEKDKSTAIPEITIEQIESQIRILCYLRDTHQPFIDNPELCNSQVGYVWCVEEYNETIELLLALSDYV